MLVQASRTSMIWPVLASRAVRERTRSVAVKVYSFTARGRAWLTRDRERRNQIAQRREVRGHFTHCFRVGRGRGIRNCIVPRGHSQETAGRLRARWRESTASRTDCFQSAPAPSGSLLLPAYRAAVWRAVSLNERYTLRF